LFIFTKIYLVFLEDKKVFEDVPEQPAGQEPVFSWIKNGQPFDPEERFKVLFQVLLALQILMKLMDEVWSFFLRKKIYFRKTKIL
jgi:hypothetical protein